MQYQEYISFLDDDMPQDDIDKLFSQLRAIEPPPSFISRVLCRVPARSRDCLQCGYTRANKSFSPSISGPTLEAASW